MAKAELGTLPIELRENIWMLSLLPDPRVYHVDPACFTPVEDPDLDGFEDERWMVPKRKYPTAMHLCQESRGFSLDIMEREQKQEQADGTPPYYCLGYGARTFNPEIDTCWFRQESVFKHHWLLNIDSVIDCQIHTIKNLAISLHYLDLTPYRPSAWNTFRWGRLGRFVSLKRVDVVFGVNWVDDDSKCKSGGSSIDLNKVELRLENWTEGISTTETLDEVKAKVDEVQASIVEIFQDMFERMQKYEEEEPPLPEGAPG